MHEIINKKKQQWVDFYDLNSSVNRLLMTYFPTEKDKPDPPLFWEYMPQREECAYQHYIKRMEHLDKIADAYIPFIRLNTGTEIFAEAFGCPVRSIGGRAVSASGPLIHDVSEWYKIKRPRLEDTSLIKLFEATDRLRERVGKDALVKLPDIQSPMDVAAMIWDKSDFYAAMFEEEPAIKELAEMVKDFMFEFLDEWFKRYGPDFITHCPDSYVPYGITVSEDEIGCISNEMYRKYFHNELVEFSERYGAIGIHCCADCKHQWSDLANVPNVSFFNIQNMSLEYIKESVIFFGKKAAIYNFRDVDYSDDPEANKIHYVERYFAESLEDAAAYAEKFREQWG